MIVRRITQDDIPALTAMGRDMHDESGYGTLAFDEACVAQKVYSILKNEDYTLGLVAVTEAGDIAGMLSSYICRYEFGPDMICADMMIYVKPEYRGSSAFLRLLKERVAWAEGQGAKQIYMGTTTGITTDKTKDLFEKLGFKPCGFIFKKEN